MNGDLFLDDYKFRLRVFPNGTNTSTSSCVGAFVEVKPIMQPVEPWKLEHVKYTIIILNANRTINIERSCDFSFESEPSNIGWHDLCQLSELNSSSGYLDGGQRLHVEASCQLNCG